MFYFNNFSLLLSSHYISANLLRYQRCWYIKINLSFLVYLIKLCLMKLQVCYDFISFLILKIVIEHTEEIFEKLYSVTIYFYDKYSWESFFVKARYMITIWISHRLNPIFCMDWLCWMTFLNQDNCHRNTNCSHKLL